MKRRKNKQIRRIVDARNAWSLERLAYAFERTYDDFRHTYRYAVDPEYRAACRAEAERQAMRYARTGHYLCRCTQGFPCD